MQKILFVDRDGTLIEEPPDNQVDALEKIRLAPGVIPALVRLRDRGYRFVMVTNQDGLGTPAFPAESFERCHQHVVELFRSQGIEFERVFICPHLAADGCDCRKPRTGLVTKYLAETALDTSASAVVGDRESDLVLAERMGLSLSGAKSRVQRARDKLRDMLLSCCHFEFDRRGQIVDYYERCCGCRPVEESLA